MAKSKEQLKHIERDIAVYADADKSKGDSGEVVRFLLASDPRLFPASQLPPPGPKRRAKKQEGK